MIYNNGYFKEELKKSYLEGRTSSWRIAIICLMLALFSYAINMFFFAMKETIVYDYFYAFSQQSFYSVMLIFNITVMVFFATYIIEKYPTITFCEINKNRWYMLKKMGYSASTIVASKQIATLLIAVVVYALSLFIILILSLLFNYTVNVVALGAICIIGIFQLLCVISVLMAISHFIKERRFAFAVVFIQLILMLFIKSLTGFMGINNDEAKMNNLANLFIGKSSIYLYSLLVIIILALIVSSILATKRANTYHAKRIFLKDVVAVDYKTNKVFTIDSKGTEIANKVLKNTVFVCIIVFILCAIAVNGLMLMMSANSSNREYKVGAYIPYEINTATMNPYIEKNDFVVFKNEGSDYEYKVDDVILYYDNNNVAQIKVIEKIDQNEYSIDIATYPEGVEVDSQQSIISKDEITGVLSYKNRWIGAWIVLNNYTIGKIFTLGIPLLIIAFYDKIGKLLSAINKSINSDNAN